MEIKKELSTISRFSTGETAIAFFLGRDILVNIN
jgi:hypothetical protein